MCGLIFHKGPSTGLHMLMAFVSPLKLPRKYHMPWIGVMNGMSHYYRGQGSTDYYRAYLSDTTWSVSLILCNEIYAIVLQYFVLTIFGTVGGIFAL